jgi:hypothetical protein
LHHDRRRLNDHRPGSLMNDDYFFTIVAAADGQAAEHNRNGGHTDDQMTS